MICIPNYSVALEGGVGAGKTSVAATLEAKYKFKHIKEYMSMADGRSGSSLAALKPINRVKFFFEIERRRCHYASQLLGKYPLALDRSFFTILAFEYAQLKMGKPAIRVDELRSLSGDFRFLIPSVIYFLDVSSPTRIIRLASRENPTRGDLVTTGFNLKIREFFDRLSRNFEVAWIDTELLDSLSVAQHIADYVSSNQEDINSQMTEKIPDNYLDLFTYD